jgi:hypothetical protein
VGSPSRASSLQQRILNKNFVSYRILTIKVFSQSTLGDSAPKPINNTSLLGATNTTAPPGGQLGYVDVNKFIKDREGSVSMR